MRSMFWGLILWASPLAADGAERCAHSAGELDTAAEAYAAAQERLAKGESGEGLRLLRQLNASAPWLALVHWAIGEAEYQRGAWLAAFVAYKRYLVQVGREAGDRADLRLRLSELETRLPVLQEYAEGEREALAENWGRVIERMTSVIDKKSSFALAYRLLGIAHAALGQKEQSLAAYARYLELEPDAHDARAVAEFIGQGARP